MDRTLYTAPGDQVRASHTSALGSCLAALLLGVLLVLVLRHDKLPQESRDSLMDMAAISTSVSVRSSTSTTSSSSTSKVKSTTTTTTTTTTEADFNCVSNVHFGQVVKPGQKGVAVDDTTFQKCNSKIPGQWPNSESGLSSLRLFKAWDKDWHDNDRLKAWHDLKAVVHRRNMKVLVGTQITCDEADDDRDWDMVIKLVQLLGREHIMGIAVGNELELINFNKKANNVSAACVKRIWEGGYLKQKFLDRATNLAFLPGFQDVPLTSVFGGYIMNGEPFVDEPTARVLPFVKSVAKILGPRFVFSVNVYPYFDSKNALEPGNTCEKSVKHAVCLEKGCLLPSVIQELHRRISQLKLESYQLWITETGWSSPMAGSLLSANPQMTKCQEFSSQTSFLQFYNSFLMWDLGVDGTPGVDHIFFFTLRDSSNFEMKEHFGLMETCASTSCKLKDYAAVHT